MAIDGSSHNCQLQELFLMTDIEGQLACEDGDTVAAAIIRRFSVKMDDIDRLLRSGLTPQEFRRLTHVQAGLKAACQVIRDVSTR